MIGSGMPISQSSAPLSKPMSASCMMEFYAPTGRWFQLGNCGTQKSTHLRGASGDFLDVVKIAQTFFDRLGNLCPTESKLRLELRRPRRSSDPSPFGLLFWDKSQVI